MVEVSRGKPTQERQRQADRAHAAGQFIGNVHASKPPEEGVTHLQEPLIRWNEKAWRWNYIKGAVVLGKCRSGQFAKKALPQRKKPKKRSRA